ncbi:hypothetical protein C8F04DRAFT_1173781 [Mycena alexandri]|uniref:Uncharacterized protein n=1 Tax=Mycena alexandri TaxID=1745969 RepID=A0AAD6TIZ8_9AGAR|nr:hypothetical protein C8F04DRAFT_1173781 [Mycena alexandri]
MSSIRSERKASTRSDPPRAPSRVSILSGVVPRRRRADTIAEDLATHSKAVLVTLKLSSQSFLDSLVKDDASRDPLYVIRTTGTATSVLRRDPWDGLVKTAEIKWPKTIPTKGKTRETLGVLVQMGDGRWQSADTILKPGSLLSAPPKFSIPNYPHSMKWKRMGSSYWCTTSSVKGPIATFHPAVEGVPPRIKVYETLHDKYDSRSISVHNGVSVLLIDHLIITAMLLVTDVQDWMLVQKYEGPGPSNESAPSLPQLSTGSASGSGSSDVFDQLPQSAPASASQWRKILYGEPIFNKPRYPNSNSRSVSTTDLTASTAPAVGAPVPTSVKQMAKILYGDPIYPSLATASPVTSLWDSDDDEDDDDDEEEALWGAQQRGSYTPSPLASPASPHPQAQSSESMMLYPASHNYLDPGYYLNKDVPPVPQIPAQYASSVYSTSRGTSPPDSARFSGRLQPNRLGRELPCPPTPTTPASPASPATSSRGGRSQSTPPRDMSVAGAYGRRPSEPLFLTPSTSILTTSASVAIPATTPPPPPRTLSRSQSMKMRQLPKPPGASDVSDAASIRSIGGLSRSGSRATRRGSQYSQRSLPVPPSPGGRDAPPPLPRPPLRKAATDEWGMYAYSWGTNGNGSAGGQHHEAEAEAPPPYIEAPPVPPPLAPPAAEAVGAGMAYQQP